jgi:hypothetical protein
MISSFFNVPVSILVSVPGALEWIMSGWLVALFTYYKNFNENIYNN